MQYLALLYDTEEVAPGTEEFDADMVGYERFGELAGDAIVGGEALQPATEAVTVRAEASAGLVTDGPFIESTEVIGGFFVLEAEDLDAAIELAREIPAAAVGAVELRPLVEWFDRSDEADQAETSTRYMAWLYGPPDEADVPGSEAWDRGAEAHARFAADAGTAVRSGGALHPAETATTVQLRDARLLVTDGCLLETREVIGGFYSIAVSDRDEAIALARRMPVSPGGAVELRPILELDG